MQLCHENSEKTSHMKILEMEIIKLKEDNKKLVKHFGQKKATSSSLEVCVLLDNSLCTYIAVYHEPR